MNLLSYRTGLLNLSSIPGFIDDIKDVKNNEDLTKAKEYKKDEKW